MHTAEYLKSTFYEASEAIRNSDNPKERRDDFLALMNDIIARARADSSSNVPEKGKRLSMLTKSSKRRKTHGTGHML